MALWKSAQRITSDKTKHFAVCRGIAWSVSYLPSRTLSEQDAVTAMKLAEALTRDIAQGSAESVQCTAWAAEIGLTLDQAQERIGRSLESRWQLLTQPRQIEPDFEAGG